MQLIKNGSIYVLPELSRIKGLGFDVRTKQESRAGTHGAAEIGDGKVDKRPIELEFFINGRSVADHDIQLDLLQKALMRQDQQLYLRPDRFINVSRLDKLKHEYQNGFGLARSKVTASLIATDPFFYSAMPVSIPTAITASPTSVTINNDGNIDAPLIVTIAASADCSLVTVTNETDGGRQFILSDVQLVDGQTAVINSALGTVYRGTSNTINTFSRSFLSLLPGENVITYTGGNCVLTLGYIPRWL